jgi:hypothetical protein
LTVFEPLKVGSTFWTSTTKENPTIPKLLDIHQGIANKEDSYWQKYNRTDIRQCGATACCTNNEYRCCSSGNAKQHPHEEK